MPGPGGQTGRGLYRRALRAIVRFPVPAMHSSIRANVRAIAELAEQQGAGAGASCAAAAAADTTTTTTTTTTTVNTAVTTTCSGGRGSGRRLLYRQSRPPTPLPTRVRFARMVEAQQQVRILERLAGSPDLVHELFGHAETFGGGGGR